MPKLTEHQKALLAECVKYYISDQSTRAGRRYYYRLGGSGQVPRRYNRHTLPKLEALGLIARDGGYRATKLGVSVWNSFPRPAEEKALTGATS